MLHLLLTFDYELFFNECKYTENDVLIRTSYRILECLKKNNVSATFFIDTLALDRYRYYNLLDFPEMVEKQINILLDFKQDIQLHIHPIWERATFDGESWNFDNAYYSLASFEDVEEIISRAKKILDELAMRHKNYNCCAFRAGGFCLNPEKRVLTALKKEGIIIDSSVCRWYMMNTQAQKFDYRKIPREPNWYINPDTGISVSVPYAEGCMYEIPVGSVRAPFKWYLTRTIPKVHYPPIMGKRTPVDKTYYENLFQKLVCKIYNAINYPLLFSVDSLDAEALFKMAMYFEKKSMREGIDYYVSIIGHPKFSSIPYVDNLDRFIKNVKCNLENTDFVTMNNIAQFKEMKSLW